MSQFRGQVQTAASWIQDLLLIANSNCFWSEGVLKFRSYGDTSAVGNGFTYTPNTQPVFDLDDDDFNAKEGEEPVTINRSSARDAYNQVTIEWSNRANSYNLEPLIEQDSWSISQFGLRPDSPQSLHGICLQTVAQAVASTILKRKVYIRNTYTFKLGWQYAQLDPMDIVTLTDPYLGLNKLPVRITKIEEAEDGLEITAEDFPWSVSAPTLYGKQPVAAPGYFSDPGNVNPPIFFEPPAELTQNVQYQLWIAVSGSQSWGGCDIYEATSETGPYKYVGTLNGASTMGNTTASLPSHADPDTTDTLSVNVAECLGTLDSFTQAEADGFQSLILVDQELMAYETATLTSPYQYNISYLRRGVFNTAITAHNSGAPFAVIDPAQLFALTYTQADVGQTRWFKFASFNLFGSQKQDISTVAAYSVTLTPPPGAPSFDVEQSPIDPTVAEVTDVSFPASPANLSITDGTFSFYYVDPETPSVDLGTALAASTSGAADTLTLGGAPPSAWNLKVGDFLVVGQEIVQTTGAASGDSIPILRGMLGSAAVAEPLTNGSTPTLVSLVQPAITKTVSWPSGFFAADGSGDSTWSLSVSLPSMILVAVTGFGTNNFGDGDVVQFFLPDGGLLLENLGTRVVNIDNAATTILSPGQQIVNVLSTTTTCTIVLPLASGMQGQDITIALMNGSTGKYVLQTQTEPTGTGDLLMGSASSYTNSTPGTSVTVVAGMDPPAGSNVFDWIAVSTSGNVSAPPVPAAPNITGVTGLSASHVIVNGAPFYLFTGQIGLPTTDPNYAHLKNIEIQALNNATGASYWLSQGEIASASFGSLTSIPFKDQELPAASTTDTPSFTLTFWVKNDANALTPNPVTNTVTVDAGVIESIGVTDNTAARVLIQGPNVATVHLEITVTLDADHGPEPITIWIYAPDYANSYGGAWRYLSNPYQIGGSGATTTIQIDTGLYVPNSSEENWQAAIFLGDIANLAGGPPETSGPNVVTFTVNGYGPPLPTDLTGCSLGPLSYTLATNGFWEWNLPYTLNIPSGIADVNFWYGALWVEKGKWDGTTWTKDPNTPDGDFVASPVTITNTWTDYVPAANDPYPHFKVWAAVETHPNGTPWTVQTGAFPSSVYSQGGEFLSGSNATYCYIAPKQQATNKPLATDITGGAVAGDVGSWAQQTADGVQYLSIPGPTFNQAPRSSDPNFQYWIVTVTVVDGDNNVITPEKVFASNGYGASDAQSLWIGYANNQYVRWKVYAANANVTNPANFSDSANCTLQTGFASGADHIDSPLFPVPAGAILASRLAGQITQSQISSVSAASIVGSIAASQIGSVSASSITGQIVASQISTVSAAAIQGAISASQIGSVSASTITGLIAASQVGSVSASAITGQIVASQIASISASVISGVISGNATITAAQITGVLVSSQLEAEILDNVSLISGGIFGPGITISGSAIQQATDNTANMASNPGFEYQGKDWSTTTAVQISCRP